MALTTSGTYKDFDIMEIIQEAHDICGLEARAHYDLEKARRGLNLLLQEWNNKQVNLWRMNEATLALTSGNATYTLNYPVIDILDGVIRNSDNLDLPVSRISREEYLNRTDKSATGRPVHFAVERDADILTLKFWPTPDASYTFVYFGINAIQEIGAFTNNPDMPRRFVPSLTYGLAYNLALKNPPKFESTPQGGRILTEGVDPATRQEIYQQYTRAFQEARDEDRDRAPFKVTPYLARV